MFKKNVSYKHEKAIEVLAEWLSNVEFERPFYIDGCIIFVPDLVTIDGIITGIYEVVHKNELTGKKLGLIQYWCYLNYDIPVYEVSAEWILCQTGKPENIKADRFYTITN